MDIENNEKTKCPKCKAKRANLELRGIWFRCWICNTTWKDKITTD